MLPNIAEKVMRRDRSDAKTGADAPWLSILIPVYNVAPWLRECVMSIIAQGVDDGVEILLLDDCSTDESLEICRELVERYPKTIGYLVHERNAGLSATRNDLMHYAAGKHIWFLDSDDYLLDGAIDELRSIITLHDPDMVICDYRKRRSLFKKSFPGFTRRYSVNQQNLICGVFKYRKMYAWLRIVRRSLWDGLQFPVGKTFEDIATTPYLLLRTQSYYYAPRGWVYYRIRSNSVMTAATRTRNFFHESSNDDMATALLDYKAALENHFGTIDPKMAFSIAHFIAKEYVKMAQRFAKADNVSLRVNNTEGNVTLRSYYDKMAASSPMSFELLQREYLKRLNFWNYFALRRAVGLATRI